MKTITLLFDSLGCDSSRRVANKNSCAEKNTNLGKNTNKRLMQVAMMLLLVFMSSVSWGQSAGFNNTFIVLSLNGGANAYYDLNAATANTDFNTASLGTFAAGSSNLILKGAEHNVYKCGGADLTSTRLNYRIYLTASPSGSYTSQSIGFTSGAANGCGGQDQQWSNTGLTTNLLTGLGAGAYTIEVYSDATITCCGGTASANNSGNNYKATFTVSSIEWGNTGASTAWYTNTNWTPNTSSAQWLSGSHAVFQNAGTATTAGINMTTASLSIGAIDITSSRTRALTIGSSTSTGTLTLSGLALSGNANVILRNSSTSLLTLQDNETGTGKTMNVALGNATTNVIDAAGSGGITISSVISGASRSITKLGASGTLTLSGANTYSGGTIISGGTLRLGAANAIPVGNPGGGVTLNGGTLSTGATTGFSNGTSSTNNMGTLTMQTSSTIALGTGNHSLYFSGASFTAGQTLTISGWTGSPGGSGTAGKIFIGSSASLTSGQLQQINFTGTGINNTRVIQLSTGEIVPSGTIYESITSGTWATLATWRSSTNNGTSWTSPATVAPSSTDGKITIKNGHTVTVGTSVSIDQVVVESGATLDQNGAVTLTIADGPGTDLDVSGIFIHTNNSITNSGQIVVQSGGILRQAKVGTAIPTATWNSGSTCEVTGWTTTNGGGLDQSFSNFTWNCASQSASIILEPSTMSVGGLFKVSSTGAGTDVLAIGNTATTRSLTVGSLQVSGGTFAIAGGSASAAMSLSVTNNCTIDGGSLQVSRTISSANSLTVNGTTTVSSGNLRILNSGSTSANSNINTATLIGNVLVSGGTIDLVSNASDAGSARLLVRGNLTLESGAIQNTRNTTSGTTGIYFDASSGTQTFTHSGGTLSTASGGIGRRFYYRSTTGPSTINEVYSAGAAQNTVNGSEPSAFSVTNYSVWPTANTPTNNITINNSSGGVTLTNSKTIGTLTLTSGTLDISTNDLTIASAGSISGGSSSTYVKTSSTGQLKRTVTTSSVSFPVGNSAYNPITLTNTGTSDTYGIIAKDGAVPNVLDATKAVNRYWAVTEGVAGSGNLAVTAQFNTADGAGASYATSTNPQFIGLYPNATPWTQVSSGAAASGSNPYTVSASGFTNTLPTSGSTYYFAVGISGAFNVPAPTITASGGVVASSPGATTSGYVGNTITINGTGLGSVTVVKVGGSAGTSVTILTQSASSLTFAAINLSGQIYVQNPGGNATSSESYTNLGYITTQTGGWSTAATWLGNAVPTSATTTNVTIAHDVTSTTGATDVGKLTVNASTTLTITAATTVNINTASTNSGTITNNGTLSTAVTYTNNGTMTINGTFQLNSGGFADGTTNFVYGSSGTLNFNASSAYTVNNTDVYWPTLNGPFNVSVLQGGVTLNSANRSVTGTFATAAGVTQTSSTLTISGTNQLNSGGFFNSAPTYSGSATLIYNNTGTFAISNEWSGNATTAGSGVPFNVTIQNSTTLTFPTTNRGIGGAFTVSSGGATLNATSGDLYVAGNFTNNGTFTHNTRAVFLNGTTQTLGGSNINGSGTTNCFPYLILQNGTNVTLAASAAVTNTLTLTSGKITLSTFDLNMGAYAISGVSSSNYIVTNSTGQLKRTVTSSAVSFPVGNSAYNPITFTNAGTSDTYGIRVADIAPANAADALVTVQRSWYITEATAGGSDLTPVVAQYNSGEVGSNYNAGTTPYMGLYNGTAWSQVATTLGGSITATSTGTAQFPATIPAGSYIAIGKDDGLASTPPSITSFSATSGYSGSSIVITGTNFTGATAVSFGGTAAASFTVNSATQITAVVGTGGTSGSVSVTTPSGTISSAGFTYLGFITTTGATDWNTGASWLGGAVPTANSVVTVAHNISIAAAFTNTPIASVTVNTGITATASATVAIGTVTNAITTSGTGVFTFSGAGGSIIAGSFVNGGTLSWSAAATLNISAGGTLTNNGTFTRGTGTVTIVNAATINGTNAITFNNLTITTGTTTLTTVPTIDGTLQLNGGSVSAAPIYTSNSTLYYNLAYSRFSEWNATGVGTIGTTPGYPNNVTINTGTFDIVNGANTARAMNGTLTINTGATFNVNALNAAVTIGGGLTTVGTGAFNMGTTNAAVSVAGAVTNAGSLTLSSTLGGDIYVAGNFTNNGTFTHNTRAVFLNGTTQTVSGSALNTSGTTNCFDYLFLQNGTNATLGASVTIRNGLTFTSGKITLSTFDLNMAGASITDPTSTSYVVTNSTGQLKRTVASSVLFPVGNTAYDPITLNNSGTSDTYGVVVVEGAISTANDATYTINRRWQVTEAVSGNSNLAVTAQYNTGEENTNYNSGTTNYLGFYNGTSWTQQAATRSGSNPFTVASNSNFSLTAANLTTGTQYFAIGKDLAFLPAAPTVTSIDVSSAYSGSTIVITGTSLTGATAVSFGGTAAASFTVNSATQITAVVGTGGASGSVSVTTPSGSGSLAGFTYLGYITTTGASNWNTAGSWLGGAVPTANNAVTVAHNLSIAAAFTNSPIASITVNTGITATASATVAIGTVTNAITTVGIGTFTFSGASGSIIAGSFVNGGTLIWSAAATLNISAAGTLTNNGTFTRGTGTVVFANAGTANGSGAITFNNLTLTAGILSLATTPTIDGTFALNGGNISTNAPIYTSNSTLQYGVTYNRFLEWSASGVGTLGTTQGYPNNVTISAGTFTVLNGDAGTARALAGNVQVNTGCTFTTGALNAVLTIGGNLTTSATGNFNMSTSNAAVTVVGSVSNAGTLALSSTVGGDLNVGGNWTNSGTFTPNSRAVTFNGTAAQAINSATTFAFLTITNSSADVTAAAAITVTSNLTINGSSTLTRLNMQTNTLTLTSATSTITSGYLRSAGTITGGTNTFGANGTYEHNFTSSTGSIPTATWSSGSTCAIIGYTSTAVTLNSTYTQPFHHFTWNCINQTVAINLLGLLTTVNGDFTLSSAGSGSLTYNSNSPTAPTLTIGRNFTVNANINLNNGSSTPTFNIGGDFSQTGGIISKVGAGVTTINFNKATGSQTFSQSGGSMTATANWNVGTGSSTNTVQLASNVNLGTGTGTFTVLGNATFDAGTNVISGSTASTFNSGANIITANTGGVNGSVTLSGTRTYNAAANYTFNNSAPSAQVTGAAVTAANNITINNSAGVTLSAGATVSGILTHTSGNMTIGANTLTLNGTVSGMSGTKSLVGSSTSNLTIGGTGALGTLFFDQTTPGTTNVLNSLNINRTAGTGTPGATLGSVLNVTTTLALASTSTLTLGGNLTVSASGSNSVAGIIAGTGALIKTGAGTLTLSAASGNNTAHTYSDGTTVNGVGTGTISVTGLTNITSATITSTAQSVTFSTTTPANGTYQLLPGALTVGTQSFTHNAGATKAVTFDYTNSTVTVATATITTTAISPTTYCAGDNVSVDFTTSGSLSGTYTAQLSNASGSFASPVAIGTGSTTTISATIPSGTSAGTGYRIRVVNTGNNITGTDNGSNITVNTNSTAAVLSGTAAICSGSTDLSVAITGGTSPFTVVYTDGTSNSTVNSYTSGTAIPVSPTATTTYSLVSVTSTGGCVGTGNSGTPVITKNNASTAAVLSGTAAICSGSTNLSVAITGGTAPFTVVYTDGTSNFTVSSYASGDPIAVSPTTTTTYSLVSVTSTGGCVGTGNSGTAVVTKNNASTAAVLSGTASTCSGTATNLQVAITGGTSPYSVVYTDGSANFTVSSYTSGSNISVSPTTTTTYTLVSVTDANGCAGSNNSGSAVVTSGATSTWNGSAWSPSTPTSTSAVVFAGNYTAATNLTFCSVSVTSGTVTIPSGYSMTLNGAITVSGGSFVVSNNANLIQNTNVANSGNILVKRNSAPILRQDYTIWSSPVTNAGLYLQAFSPMTLSTRFYTYNPSSNVYVAVASPAATPFELGTGYLVRVANNHNAVTPTSWEGQFTGVPNNGPVSLSVTSGTYNAIGNPYPSAINADAFITNNSLSEPLYFWRKTNNALNSSYATYNLTGGTANSGGGSSLTPDGVIQVGQGFIAKASSSSLSFTNSIRLGDTSEPFFRHSADRSRIWLNLTNPAGYFGQTLVAYMPGATNGVDAGMDGLYINDYDTALNSIIDGAEFTIQARALPFNATDIVPLAFKTGTAGTFSIALDHVDGLFSSGTDGIYVHDLLTGAEQNLRDGAYTFTTEAGVFNSRFELGYSSLLAVNGNTFTANQVVVYQQDSVLVVNAAATTIATVQLYDLRGRLLLEKKGINASEVRMNVVAENQVLLVKVITTTGETVTKKIIH